MEKRKAPAWFVRKLKDIDRRLMVIWDDARHCWAICEKYPTVKFRGIGRGIRVYQMLARPERRFSFKDLGTGILDYIRRVDTRRFDSVDGMIAALDIDNGDKINGRSAFIAKATAS